jgi:crotonobetainyl-CoA:carnitine CoA-transferase CaiB-like acyl-CoA transferase
MHSATPDLGEHTAEVLAELGISTSELKVLKDRGIV